ncbi:MAG: hypothetical protein NUV80_00970 [Candidatus Berkelbacteria bacterium]|nr:hypothetical protein [Candidatus Berkelbacteria bacterium]
MPQQTESKLLAVFNQFNQAFSPAAHLNSLTERGNKGHASAMANIDILDPTHITQGPALSNLINGTQAGVVSELINFILDRAVSSGVTYGIGPTKLFRITTSAVTDGSAESGTWPHTITGATDGESCIELNGVLYYFYNKSSKGDIGKFDHAGTFTDAWGTSLVVGGIEKNIHPVTKKEDLMVFGNGRYLGVYDQSSDTLSYTKLDFGPDAEVIDVIFHANLWWIAVNYGVAGTNSNYSEIFLYDGSATATVLNDETGIGRQKIGFLYVLNGRVFVAYQDLSSTGGFRIGYISGRQLISIASFTGTLPGFHQKTLYKNTILFVSNALLWSAGAVSDDLPIQISQIADGGYATVGAIAAPFGTPMVASTDGGSNHRLAQFSGFDTACTWRSVVVPVIQGKYVAHLDYVVVRTKVLGASARCDLQIEYNQAVSSNTAIQITGTGATRFVKALGIKDVEDMRVFLDWSSGHATNDCGIKEIQIWGHFVMKPGS